MKTAIDKKVFKLFKRKYVISYQDNDKQYSSGDQTKTVIIWFESIYLSAIFTRHCTFRLWFIQVFLEFSWWKKSDSPEDCKSTFSSSLLKILWENGIIKLPPER